MVVYVEGISRNSGYMFPPLTQGMWPCIITVITNALGHMYVYSSPRAVERVKIYVEISCKSL